MASSSVPTGSNRPRDPSVQGLNIKFLINITMKVDSVDQAQKTCAYLLDALSGGFTEEDMKCMKENVAVIFGLNGKYSEQLDQDLEKLKTFNHDCKPVQIKHKVITYTWGEGGTIAPQATTPPYQEIQEYLKNHPDTVQLVKWLKGSDKTCLVYFSFIDSDTFKFNSIYSEYLQIVRDELKKDSIPPTVMLTGYEFTHDRVNYIVNWLDREVLVGVEEDEPFYGYYPAPNFCVLVKNGLDTIKESFIDRERKDGKSAVLMAQVKNRDNFKAVFPQKKPTIIDAPERVRLQEQGLMTEMNLKTGPYFIIEGTKKLKIQTFGQGSVIKIYHSKDK